MHGAMVRSSALVLRHAVAVLDARSPVQVAVARRPAGRADKDIAVLHARAIMGMTVGSILAILGWHAAAILNARRLVNLALNSILAIRDFESAAVLHTRAFVRVASVNAGALLSRIKIAARFGASGALLLAVGADVPAALRIGHGCAVLNALAAVHVTLRRGGTVLRRQFVTVLDASFAMRVAMRR
jgi:hypothetical protein